MSSHDAVFFIIIHRFPMQMQALEIAAADHKLQVAAKLEDAGYIVEAHHLSASDAVDGLLTFQVDNDIDIMVVGAYGHSKWQQLFLGSTTTEIIASTLSPVILVR